MLNSLSTKRDLVKLLDSLLLPHHFVRHKDDWYLDNGECVAIIGLGKSLYGGQFSLGIDFLLKELCPDLLPFPPRHLCHFRGYGVEPLLSDYEGELLKQTLNLENKMSSADRISCITSAICYFAVPFVTHLNSKRAIAQAYKTDEDFEAYCRVDLKLALEQAGYLTREELEFDFDL